MAGVPEGDEVGWINIRIDYDPTTGMMRGQLVHPDYHSDSACGRARDFENATGTKYAHLRPNSMLSIGGRIARNRGRSLVDDGNFFKDPRVGFKVVGPPVSEEQILAVIPEAFFGKEEFVRFYLHLNGGRLKGLVYRDHAPSDPENNLVE